MRSTAPRVGHGNPAIDAITRIGPQRPNPALEVAPRPIDATIVAMDPRRHAGPALALAVATPFFLCCAASPAQAQPAGERRPTTHEDVWLMRRVGTPVLDPAGARAIVAVTEPSYDSDETMRDLWLVTTDGSAPPRRLTSTPGGESAVSWRPDGAQILFAARRGDDEKSQAYVLDMNAPGEARRVTSHGGGVSNPRWSPDGRHLLFESTVDADDGTDLDADVAASAYDTFPIRYWDRWLDDRQVHVFVQPIDGSTAPRDLLAGTKLVGHRGFSASPGRGQDSLQACWTPDGDEILFVATTERDRSAFDRVRYHIYRVPVAGGEPRRLTGDPDGSESGPRFDATGQRLLFMRSPKTKFVYDHAQLMLMPWPGDGSSRRLASDFDRPIHDFATHGDRLWVVASEHGRRRIFTGVLTWDAKELRLLDPASRGVYAGIAVGGDEPVLLARWEDSTHPAEVVRVEPTGGHRQRLTEFNVARAAELDRQPFREFWFENAAGNRIHCWLVLPPAFDETKKYPLLTWMHGGPHSTSLDADHVRWSPHLMAAPGYVVVLVDYTGSVGYGEAFARAIQGDPLRTPGHDLLHAARAAAEKFAFVDLERQAALGASYGGHLANWMLATTDHFRCLVGHAGLVSLEGQWATSDVIHHRELNNGGPPWGDSTIWREQSPSTFAANFKTPTLLTVGESDYRVPLNQTIAAWSYMQRQQCPGRLIVFHKANHWIMRGADARYFWNEVHAWLAQHLAAGR